MTTPTRTTPKPQPLPHPIPGYLLIADRGNNRVLDDACLPPHGVVTVADTYNCGVLDINHAKRIIRQVGTPASCVHHPPRSRTAVNGGSPLAGGGILVGEITGSWIDGFNSHAALVVTPAPVRRHQSPGPIFARVDDDSLTHAARDLFETRPDELLDERLGQRTVDREMQRALCRRVGPQLVCELRKDRAAERQVAQVMLKRSEAGDRLAPHAKRRHTVRENFLGVRDDLENCAAQRLERVALRLINTSEVCVNILSRHRNESRECSAGRRANG